MTLGISVPLSQGREIKGLLKIKRVYEDAFIPLKEEGRIVFPIRGGQEDVFLRELKEITHDFVIKDFSLQKNSRTRSFRRELQKILPKELYETAARSYEQVGDIGIISVFPHVEQYEKEIAEALQETNKGIRLILKKTGRRTGVERLPVYEVLAGEGSAETTHKENGVQIKLDVTKVYFSARTAQERKRILSLVKPEEKVLVLFSGCGPYPLVIAKNIGATVWGVELSESAHEYAQENVALNELQNVTLLQGDVRAVIPTIQETFDRIIIPHPTEGDYYIAEALSLAKNTCVMHLYHFSRPEKINYALEKIERVAKQQGFFAKVVVVEQMRISQEVTKYCFDIQLKKL